LVDGTTEYPLVTPDEMAAEAWAAMARHDAAEALRLWQKLREDFPERPEGHVWPIQVLWLGGRLEEADVMAADAFARFPDHPDLLVQYAWIAMSRQRWEEALRWWTAVRSRAPERIEGYIWAARALWQCGRMNDAETMAADAVARFPKDIAALAEHAWVAVARYDWNAALLRWRRVCRAEPERQDGQIGLIQALRMIGRVDEAEAMGAKAIASHPDAEALLVEHVWTAVAREDWAEAAARLEAARVKLNDAERFESALGWVEYRLRLQEADGSAPVAEAPTVLRVPGEGEPGAAGVSVTDLMLSFESLGERCDFGAVQRHYGVEPLGLLRFAFSQYEALMRALEDRFSVVGTVEDTGFELYKDENILVMKKYNLIFHTFVSQKELPTPQKREAFRLQQRRRLAFLKDKLVSDLEDPQKIYVYSTEERAADADTEKLFAALRAYGPNTLLYVRPADDGHPAGTVEKRKDGLFIGYFTGMADFVAGNQPPFEQWRELCERTYRFTHGDGR
jgi:tetratricopeptide (TPR) repeat protein